MKRQEHHFGSTIVAQQGYCTQTVKNRHSDVDYQHIRIETPHLRNGIPSVVDNTNNVKFSIQYCSYPCQNSFMIVSEQHSHLVHNNRAHFY